MDSHNDLEKLYMFMKKYKNEFVKNIQWTHLMTYEPYGSYNIPENKRDKFLKLYTNAITAGYIPCIVEKHKECGPIVIDLDFIYSKEYNEKYYTETMILDIVKLYNLVIKKYIDEKSLLVTEKMTDAYVLEKKQPNLRKGNYCDGIHIIYPYICTKPSLQILMRQDFLKLIAVNNIFKEMPLQNNLDSIFDKNIVYNIGWMMYGSRKNPSANVYSVTHIYRVYDDKIIDMFSQTENNKPENIWDFVNLLSCRRFNDETSSIPLNENFKFE
jgi:hypothetical protein